MSIENTRDYVMRDYLLGLDKDVLIELYYVKCRDYDILRSYCDGIESCARDLRTRANDLANKLEKEQNRNRKLSIEIKNFIDNRR